MTWTQGGTYFHGRNYAGAASCYDARGCFHLVALSLDSHSIDHMVQGSRSPFPVAAYSIHFVEKATGTPTITFSFLTGFLRIFVPLENVGIEEWAAKQEDFPDPSGDPIIPKCSSPYHREGKLLVWSGTSLTTLSTKDNALFKEADLPAYYDALVADGVNAERSFAYFTDGDTNWDSFLPCNPGFYEHLNYRLGLIKERDLTEIMCLTPYGGENSFDEVREIIRRTKSFLPNIIYECVNEPTTNDRQKRIVDILKDENIPNKYIQINFLDSGEFGELLTVWLNGEGLACAHRTGSMETIRLTNELGKAWEGSPGCMRLMGNGLYGSNDGDDVQQSAKGLTFWAQKPEDKIKYRRSDNNQITEITSWMLAHGRGVGFEVLSACGFQASEPPDLKEAIRIGRDERRAMSGMGD